MKESKQYKIFKVFNVCILLIIIFCTLYPFINVVAQSFSSESYINSGQVNLFPKGFNVETYQKVLSDTMFWINYKNTVVYTVVGTIISMFLTTIFAYALSKRRLVGRRFLTVFAVFTMFFNGGLIPNYVLINALGFANTMWAIVIPGAISIYNMLIMKSFFENMPEELEEAAAIDGLNTYGILLKIVLPLSKAVIATMVLFYAVAYWNSWFSALIYLTDQNLQPLQLILRQLLITNQTLQSQATGDMATQLRQTADMMKYAAIVVSTLPIMMVYPFLQKYFNQGVMVGAIKE